MPGSHVALANGRPSGLPNSPSLGNNAAAPNEVAGYQLETKITRNPLITKSGGGAIGGSYSSFSSISIPVSTHARICR